MSDVAAFNYATTQFNRYAPMPTFFLGLIGNLLNVYIFTRQSLSKNSCTLYLLTSTYMDILVLFFGIVIRSLMDGFGVDLVGNSLALCRLPSIDRFCITSRRPLARNFSRRIIAGRAVLLASGACLLLYSHVLGLFELQQLSTGRYCYAQVGLYRIIYDFLFSASFCFFPPILMAIMELATVIRIRRTRAQVTTTAAAIVNPNALQLKRKDRQLISVLLIQLMATIICSSLRAIEKLYTVFTANDNKTPMRTAIEGQVTRITRQLLYINASVSFYVYISSMSSVFRQEFIHMIQFTFRRNTPLETTLTTAITTGRRNNPILIP